MRIIYRYRNLGLAPLDLWVAEPVEGLTQRDVAVVALNQPAVQTVDTGSTTVTRYRVAPFRVLTVVWEFTPTEASPGGGVLSPPDRARCLRVSPQVGREAPIVRRAEELASGMVDAVDIARRLHEELITAYKYRYPVWRRGALAMERSRSGDCGQFAALFVAWCRALGIPARAVVGTLISAPGMHPHAWAEFWSDRLGWVPVDPSLGQAAADPAQFFGWLPADRFAFSYDLDNPLPQYGAAVRFPPLGQLLTPLFIGGKHVRWGAQTIEGAIPWLQPAYPRAYSGWGPNFLLSASMGGWSTETTARAIPWRSPTFLVLLGLLTAGVQQAGDLTSVRGIVYAGWLLEVLSVGLILLILAPMLRTIRPR
jgi:transglutaminase-like putative cysteine protease